MDIRSRIRMYVGGRASGKTYEMLKLAEQQECIYLTSYKHKAIHLKNLESFSHVKVMSLQEYKEYYKFYDEPRLPVIIDDLSEFLGDVFCSDVMVGVNSHDIKINLINTDTRYGFKTLDIPVNKSFDFNGFKINKIKGGVKLNEL